MLPLRINVQSSNHDADAENYNHNGCGNCRRVYSGGRGAIAGQRPPWWGGRSVPAISAFVLIVWKLARKEALGYSVMLTGTPEKLVNELSSEKS